MIVISVQSILRKNIEAHRRTAEESRAYAATARAESVSALARSEQHEREAIAADQAADAIAAGAIEVDTAVIP